VRCTIGFVLFLQFNCKCDIALFNRTIFVKKKKEEEDIVMLVLKLLKSRPVLFTLGAMSAASWGAVSPALGKMLRPALKEMIKGGIILQKQIQTIAQEAWQDVEDLTAEAKAEVEATKKEPEKKDNGTGQGET
jgi:Protein of unknown function (DUF5132)